MIKSPGTGHSFQMWMLAHCVTGFVRAYGANDLGGMVAAQRGMAKWTGAMCTSVQLGIAEELRQEQLELRMDEPSIVEAPAQ